MARKRAQRAKKNPPGVTDEFVVLVQGLGSDQLKELVVRNEQHIIDCRSFLKNDEKVQELKRAYDEVKGPTEESIRHLQNRNKHALDRLREVGSAVASAEVLLADASLLIQR